MCGRYTNRYKWREIHGQLSFFKNWEAPEEDPKPRANMAPTQMAPIVVATEGHGGKGVMARWDLVPFWWKKPLEEKKWTSINARAEEVIDKPAFRDALKRKRCLVPNDGFLEWKTIGKEKQPYWLGVQGDKPEFFAGLWDEWSGVHKGEPVSFVSFCILVCAPNAIAGKVHNRMPAILLPEDLETWLFAERDEAMKLIGSYPEQMMRANIPVSKLLGAVKNDDRMLLQQVMVDPAFEAAMA